MLNKHITLMMGTIALVATFSNISAATNLPTTAPQTAAVTAVTDVEIAGRIAQIIGDWNVQNPAYPKELIILTMMAENPGNFSKYLFKQTPTVQETESHRNRALNLKKTFEANRASKGKDAADKIAYENLWTIINKGPGTRLTVDEAYRLMSPHVKHDELNAHNKKKLEEMAADRRTDVFVAMFNMITTFPEVYHEQSLTSVWVYWLSFVPPEDYKILWESLEKINGYSSQIKRIAATQDFVEKKRGAKDERYYANRRSS